MRVMLVSDTHGDFFTLQRLVLAQPKAEAVLFLGDGLRELEDVRILHPDKAFYAVRGNCDWNSDEKGLCVLTLNGVRIVMTHGHAYGVKYGLDGLRRLAAQHQAQVVCYGHSHAAAAAYEDGVYYVNPGSPTRPREGAPSYGVLDLTDSGIMPVIVRLDYGLKGD